MKNLRLLVINLILVNQAGKISYHIIMRRTFLISIILYVISNTLAAQNSYRQIISNYGTLEFPGKPQAKDTLGKRVYYYPGDSAYYVALMTEDDKAAEILKSESDLYEYYDGMIESMLELEKGKLIAKNKIDFKGFKGIDIEYSVNAKKNMPDLKFKRIIFLNLQVIDMEYWTLSGNKNVTEQDRMRFFNSFGFLKKPPFPEQYQAPEKVHAHSSAYMLGKMVGRIVGFLIVILFIGFIIYLVAKK